MSSFCLCYIALTGSVSGSVEVMNLIMIDISPILLFFARIVYLFCSKKCSFLFGTYFAQNSASKIYQCLVGSECTSNTFNGNGAYTSSCSDPPLETVNISCADSHTIGLCDAIVITSCTFTNNTSDRGALSIASGCDDHAYYKLNSVLITCCVFTNKTSYQNGGAFSIASRNESIIIIIIYNKR